MVSPEELVDLDPNLEDILSMWGKDTSTESVELFFGAQKISSPVLSSLVELPPFLHQGGAFESEVVSAHNQSSQGPIAEEVVVDGSSAGAFSLANKGKSILSWNPPSKGLEDIEFLGYSSGVGKDRVSGGYPPLSRVSLPRDPRTTGAILIGGCEGHHGSKAGVLGGFDVSSCGKNSADIHAGGPSTHFQSQPEDSYTVDTPQEDIEWSDNLGELRASQDELRKKGEKRKSQKPIGSQDLGGNLVLGMEVSIKETLEVEDCTIVGKARGKKFTPEVLQAWGEERFVNGNPLRFEAQCLVKG